MSAVRTAVALGLVVTTFGIASAQHGHGQVSPYREQHEAGLRALSAAEVDDLQL